MSRVADLNDVLWMLEMIWRASRKNAAVDANEDWNSIAATAHMCLHYVGEGCTLAGCSGTDINEVMRLAGRYS